MCLLNHIEEIPSSFTLNIVWATFSRIFFISIEICDYVMYNIFLFFFYFFLNKQVQISSEICGYVMYNIYIYIYMLLFFIIIIIIIFLF